MVGPLVKGPDKGYILMTYQGGDPSCQILSHWFTCTVQVDLSIISWLSISHKIRSPSTGGRGLFPNDVKAYADISRGLVSYFPVKIKHQLRSWSWWVCVLTVCEFMYFLSLVMFCLLCLAQLLAGSFSENSNTCLFFIIQ